MGNNILIMTKINRRRMGMKKLTLSLTCFLFFILTTHAIAGNEKIIPANPSDGYYVSFHGGVAFLDDSDITDDEQLSGEKLNGEFDTGYAVDVAIGYKHETQRIEGEVSYQQNDFDKVSYLGDGTKADGDISALTFLFNYYFDIPTKFALKPFITAGIGVSRIDVNDLSFSDISESEFNDHDTVLAYQFGIGASIALSESVDVELKYRYFATQDPDFDSTEAEIWSNNVLLGLRIAL